MTYRWSPNGPLLGFTAATTAPTAVQCISLSNVNSMDVKIDNTSGTVDAVLGWGQRSADAISAANAGSNTSTCAYIMRGTVQVISIPNGTWITGKTASSTADIKVQSGIGN